MKSLLLTLAALTFVLPISGQMLQPIIGSGCTITATALTGGIYDSPANFSGWGNNATTNTPNSIVAPDCTNNAIAATETTAANTGHYLGAAVVHTFTAHATTLTFYFSRNSGVQNGWGYIFSSNFSSEASAGITLSSCAVTLNATGTGSYAGLVTATGTAVGNWCKETISVSSITDTELFFGVGLMSGAATLTYTGVASNTDAFWGVDLR